MGLSNSQYQAIMREYERLQAEDRSEYNNHMEEIYHKIPEYKTLEDKSAKLAMDRLQAMMKDAGTTISGLEEELRIIEVQKRELLKAHGLPEDYDKMHYTCEDCHDTGHDSQGKKCHCFKAREVSLLYAQSGLQKILERENFEHLSATIYDDKKIITKIGMTEAAYMKTVVGKCRDYVENFGSAFENLIFMGHAGVGKTFLSNCIAKELIDRYYSVIYLSSTELFDCVGRVKTDRDAPLDMKELYGYILDSDLLIIDDLGTELNNSLVSSQLFFIINRRLNTKHPTIISTNLSMSMLRDTYTERVSSRIASEYMPITLYGDDLRQRR